MPKTVSKKEMKGDWGELKYAPAQGLLADVQNLGRLSLPVIFNTMRILKRVNPGDCYYENYLGMLAKYGDSFMDIYQVIWNVGINLKPKRILEIGSRTGISLCQLLSSYIDLSIVEKVACVDPFDQWTSPNLIRANLRALNLKPWDDKADIIPIKSEEYFERAEGRFDYILVDGDHTKPAARQDLEGAHGLIEKGGIILFDDISTAPGECALMDVWEDFKESHKDDYSFAEFTNGKGAGWAIKL